jgi:TPR repeat protein
MRILTALFLALLFSLPALAADGIGALRTKAENGDADAQYKLGRRYKEHANQDYVDAATWYLKAAEQGNADAQLDLGLLYEHGLGVSQNDIQAYMWYRRAAKQGNPNAQEQFGRMHTGYPGIKQDYAEAYFWYCLAMEQLNTGPISYDDARNMALAKQSLTSEQIKAVRKRVQEWKPTPERPPAPAAAKP